MVILLESSFIGHLGAVNLHKRAYNPLSLWLKQRNTFRVSRDKIRLLRIWHELQILPLFMHMKSPTDLVYLCVLKIDFDTFPDS